MTDWMLYCAVLCRYPSNKSACLCIGHFVFGLKWWKQYSDYFVVSPPASPQHRPCTGKWPLPSNTRLATHYHYTALLCHWVAVLPPRTYHPAHSSNVYHPKHCPFQLQPHPSGLCLHKPMPKTHLRWLSWLIEFCFNLLLWRVSVFGQKMQSPLGYTCTLLNTVQNTFNGSYCKKNTWNWF